MSKHIERVRDLEFSDTFHQKMNEAHTEALEAINKLILLACTMLEHPDINQDHLESVADGALTLIDAEMCQILQNIPDALRAYMAIQDVFTSARAMEHSRRPENPLEN